MATATSRVVGEDAVNVNPLNFHENMNKFEINPDFGV
jgi:hypothetical protein